MFKKKLEITIFKLNELLMMLWCNKQEIKCKPPIFKFVKKVKNLWRLGIERILLDDEKNTHLLYFCISNSNYDRKWEKLSFFSLLIKNTNTSSYNVRGRNLWLVRNWNHVDRSELERKGEMKKLESLINFSIQP